ncbi:MAG TPA: hypothetical protein VD932_03650 [Aquabacterium sp.]|nr:hypothetical protein [Aquabacterium sp.]
MHTIRKKLAPTWFTLITGTQPAPEFLLAPLTSLEWLDVRNEIYQAPSGEYVLSAKAVRTCVESAVRDWRNIAGEDGEAARFSRELLLELPATWLNDLATEVSNRAALSEKERKNSSSPSTSH